MPTKKRKYEARFPPARIKKIMQTDEEIGKVAAPVPVIISRALEIFLQSLIKRGSTYTMQKKAKTMTTSHLKCCIEAENEFDFLQDLVSNIATVSNKEEEENVDGSETKPKKPRKPREPKEKAPKKQKEKIEKPSTTDESENEDARASLSDEEKGKTPSSSNASAGFPSVVFPRDSVITPNPAVAATISQRQPSSETFANFYGSAISKKDDDYDDDYDS